MCKLFNITRSSYYHWLKHRCATIKTDKSFNELLKQMFQSSYQTYKTRRLKAVLEKNYSILESRRYIAKSLKQMNLKVKMKRRFKVVTATSNHTLPISTNKLQRDFYTSSCSKAYVGDITYIPTKQGPYCYVQDFA